MDEEDEIDDLESAKSGESGVSRITDIENHFECNPFFKNQSEQTKPIKENK